MNGGDALIANILGAFIVAIFAQSVFHIASRGFYAYQDTRTPLLVSVVAIGLTIVLSILFYVLDFGPDGLGWAQSIGAILEVVVLLFILNKRASWRLLSRDFWRAMRKMFFAGIITACVAYSMTKFLPLMATDNSFYVTFPKFCVITFVSFLAYLLASYFLSLEEISPFIRRLKKIIFRNME